MISKLSLLEVNPALAREWHPSNNGSLSPSDVTPGSNKKVWWKCPIGDDHEWPAMINRRNKGSGCPICSNQRVAVSNSLGTTNPRLAREWHPTRNGGLTPFDVLPSTKRKVWWECAANPSHEFSATLNNRTNGKGCPYCSNQRISEENSLGTVNPVLAEQWHPTKNGKLTPFDVAPSASRRVWWKCPKGDDHEWRATVNHRATGTGCPKCNPVWSAPELRIFSELKTIFPSIQHRARIEGVEVDIYIPELQVGIEFDGVHWHQDKLEKDKSKNSVLEPSVLLIRIREEGLPLIGPYDIAVKKRKLSISAVKKILTVIMEQRSLSLETTSNVQAYLSSKKWIATKLFKQLYSERKLVKFEESLAYLFPELSQEWHPSKNDSLLPKHFSHGSGITVWWLGSCGHEWQDSINHRTSGRNCPNCRYKRAGETRRKNRVKYQKPLFD